MPNLAPADTLLPHTSRYPAQEALGLLQLPECSEGPPLQAPRPGGGSIPPSRPPKQHRMCFCQIWPQALNYAAAASPWGWGTQASRNGAELQGSRFPGLIHVLRTGEMVTRQSLCPVLPFTENFLPMVLRPQGLVIIEATLTEAHSLFQKPPPSYFLFSC